MQETPRNHRNLLKNNKEPPEPPEPAILQGRNQHEKGASMRGKVKQTRQQSSEVQKFKQALQSTLRALCC